MVGRLILGREHFEVRRALPDRIGSEKTTDALLQMDTDFGTLLDYLTSLGVNDNTIELSFAHAEIIDCRDYRPENRVGSVFCCLQREGSCRFRHSFLIASELFADFDVGVLP